MSRKLTDAADSTGVALPMTAAGRPLRPAELPPCIRGVLFDVCNVLYDNTVWRRWLLKVLARLGLHTSYHSFFRIWDREYLVDVYRGRTTFADAFRAFLLSAGLSAGQIDEVEASCRARRRELQQTARPLPGVKATLARLHQIGLVLGAVADGEHTAAEVMQQLERFGVGSVFVSVASSIDLGRTMPDPACYLRAVKAMELPAEQVAFVGHDTMQLDGAAAVGMPTIAVNYDLDARADLYLGRLDELLDLFPASQARAAG